MENKFWIFFKTKKRFELVIDIYDGKYMERPREERFSELKALLTRDIMEIRRVHMLCEDNGFSLEIKKSWCAIERIVAIHQWLEKYYVWMSPWEGENPVFENGSLVLDESCDNSLIPHYRVIPLRTRRKIRPRRHADGDIYLKSDGEVYTTFYGTERRLCEVVWETFNGYIPEGCTLVHIDGDLRNNRLDNLRLVFPEGEMEN